MLVEQQEYLHKTYVQINFKVYWKTRHFGRLNNKFQRKFLAVSSNFGNTDLVFIQHNQNNQWTKIRSTCNGSHFRRDRNIFETTPESYSITITILLCPLHHGFISVVAPINEQVTIFSNYFFFFKYCIKYLKWSNIFNWNIELEELVP